MDFFDNLNRGINLVYGPAATGKTTLGLQKTLEFSKKHKVLFFDAENTFSTERLKQMDKAYESCLGNIFIIKPKTFTELNHSVEKIKKISQKFKFIVLDSFGVYYRLDLQKNGHIKTNELAVDLLRKLRNISKKTPVLIMNQIYETKNGKNALGGKMIQNFCDKIIELEIDPRKIKIIKPKNYEFEFKITNKGIEIIS